jgi:NAD(P)-dependent dehydrogenase (short-subunit alcohol dehydrogenase family)
VTKPDQVTACADALNKSGGVDILVANAGIARSGTAGEDTADEHWLDVIDVNLNGVFWCCRAFQAHAGARQRRHRQHRLDVRLHRQQAAEAGLLQRLEGGIT